MAKAGDITATGTDADIKAAVQGDLTPELTLGAVAAAALSGSDDPLNIAVDLLAGTVKVYGPAAMDDVNFSASEPGEAVFTLDDATKKVAPWTGSGASTDLTALANDTAKPSRSMASLVSVLEDAIRAGLDPTTNPTATLIVVSQDNLKVGALDRAHVEDNVSATPLATFTQVVPTAGGHIRGLFE